MTDAFSNVITSLAKLGPIGGERWLYGWQKLEDSTGLCLTRGGRTYLQLSEDDLADFRAEAAAEEWRKEAISIMSGEKVAPVMGYRDGFAPPLSNDPEEDFRTVPDAADAAVEALGSILRRASEC